MFNIGYDDTESWDGVYPDDYLRKKSDEEEEFRREHKPIITKGPVVFTGWLDAHGILHSMDELPI